MIFAALDEAARRGELLLVDGGLCRFHLRRDGIVVIREILVLPHRRREGIGQRLVGMLKARHSGSALLARCPAGYEANGFWQRLGFGLAAEENELKVWQWLPS